MGIRSLLRTAFGRAARGGEQDEASLPQQSTGPGACAPAASEEAPDGAVTVPTQPTAEESDRAGTPTVPDPGPLGPIPTPGPARPEPLPEPEPQPTPMPKPKPVPEPEPAPRPDPHPVPEPPPGPDPEPSPAMAAGAALAAAGLTGRRTAVYLVLDRSGSMRPYYKDGTVQHLAEQTLALAGHLTEGGTLPVVFFSTGIDGTAELTADDHRDRIAELHASYGHMGRTHYHLAVEAVLDHYRATGTTDPALVVFQTDGAPSNRAAAEKALCEAAGLPVFWQFVGFGDPEARGFDFLRRLDDLAVPERRAVDNTGFFHAGRDPRLLPHEELYRELLLEFPGWLQEARTAGVLR
ncbi:VWA domain-containing protein [Streptomyces sp. NPDC049585]|uniref:VWA domain-containing protein n=1 Tax=Streptomyces sp. NPDC049585 TaxID=3155154 RepID=UPI00341C4D67